MTFGGTTYTVTYLRDKGVLKTTSDLRDKVGDKWESSKLKERSENIRENMEDKWEKSDLRKKSDKVKEQMEERWDNLKKKKD